MKIQLEGLQAHVGSRKGVAGSEDVAQVLKEFATNQDSRIAELAPAPKETTLHAQSQKLQRKIGGKTKQAQGLTQKIQQLRATLKPLLKQYDSSNERWVELRAQWQQLGQHIGLPVGWH